MDLAFVPVDVTLLQTEQFSPSHSREGSAEEEGMETGTFVFQDVFRYYFEIQS